MDKFVPYEKLSKKQKKAADRAKRTVWTMNPVTRKPENPKAYNRRKALYGDHDPGEVLFPCARRAHVLTGESPETAR